jgi:hypothetical protein
VRLEGLGQLKRSNDLTGTLFAGYATVPKEHNASILSLAVKIKAVRFLGTLKPTSQSHLCHKTNYQNTNLQHRKSLTSVLILTGNPINIEAVFYHRMDK